MNKPPDKNNPNSPNDLPNSSAKASHLGSAADKDKLTKGKSHKVRPGSEKFDKLDKSPRSEATQSGPPLDPQDVKPPENSLGVRIVAFGMAVIAVGIGDYFVSTQPLMIVAHLIALTTGTYLSYINRQAKTPWQPIVMFGGIGLVGVNCWLELQSGVKVGELSPFTPAIHFLAGTYVMQSFELRTRTEINTSMMLGLLILALIAPLSKSIIFGAGLLIYICLWVALLYFDCVMRSKEGIDKEPLSEIVLMPAQEKKSLFFKSNAVMCLAVFPIVSTVTFLFLPRADNLVDNIYAYVSSLTGKKAQAPLMVPDTLPENTKRWTPPQRKKTPNSKSMLSTEKGKKSNKPGDPGDAGSEDKEKSGESGKGKPGAAAGANSQTKTAADKQAAAKSKTKASKAGAKGGTDKEAGDNNESIGYDDEVDISLNASTSNTVLLKVRSNRTCYLKMNGLDKFEESGKWTSTLTEADPVDRDGRNGMELSQVKSLLVPTNFPAVLLDQDCIVVHDLGLFIPAAWIPKNLDLKSTDKVFVDEMGALRLPGTDELKAGTKYKVKTTFPVYDLGQMRTAPPLDPATQDDLRFRLSRYLQMPKELPEQLIALSDSVTAGGANWFTKAELATNYLRKTYGYSYTKNHAESSDPLFTFLYEDPAKQGDCKDFATALIMMLRAEGVPARMIRGFSPGDFNSVAGCHEIKFKNLHSWAEVYIPDHGWVPFDATPKGYLPDKPREQSFDLENLKKKKEDLEQLAPREQEKVESEGKKISWEQVCMLLSGLGVVSVCLFFLVKAILRAIKKARENASDHHAAKKFLKRVEADLKKWKVVRMPHETGVEFSRRVKLAARERARLGQSVDTDVALVVESFMDTYEAAYYGNKDRLQDLEELSKRIHQAIGKGGDKGSSPGQPPAASVGARSAGKDDARPARGGAPKK